MDSNSVKRFIDDNRQRYVDELKEFLRIPSVSTLSEHKSDIQNAAQFVRTHLTGAGLETRMIETAGHPIVYGEWMGRPGAPTVLVYGHYDVQPVDPRNLWRHDPFDPTIEGEDLIARGSTDDKGQLFAHIKGVEAWHRTHGELPVNVKFCVEGEEEIGSPHLDPFIEENQDLLACDMVVISDSSQFGPRKPAITYGLRGLLYMEVSITGPSHDLHSGSYGGALENPARALGRLITSLHHKNGKVMIPGFYDDVVPLTRQERKAFADLKFKENAFKKEIGVKNLWGESGYTTLERIWARPTCELNGVFGGFMGEGAKTVIPSRVGAKISFRLVANQDPDKIARAFRKHVKDVLGNTVQHEVKQHAGSGPVLVPRSGGASQVAEAATRRGFGKQPVFIREGGSIPVVLTFTKTLKAPVSLIGFGLPDDRAHSPNEKFHLPDFHRGILTASYVLDEASRVPVGQFLAKPEVKGRAPRNVARSAKGRGAVTPSRSASKARSRPGGTKSKKSKPKRRSRASV